MSGPATDDGRSIALEASAFLDRFDSLVLATVNASGTAHASQAPFVRNGAFLYIYVSQLAEHTGNLERARHASLLLAAPDVDTPEPFARTRLTLECNARTIPRESTRWNEVLGQFQARFGDIMQTLMALDDFKLIELSPARCVFVRGFASAHRFEGPLP